MLSASELAARIAAEFLRVGASQQSWDQNFPNTPSVWVPDPVTGTPVLSPESQQAYEEIANPVTGSVVPVGGGIQVPPPRDPAGGDFMCASPYVKVYRNGRWLCELPPGYLDPEEEFEVGAAPSNPGQPGSGSQPTSLPPFMNGRLGKVLFTPIPNRKLNGVRYGTLPQVVFGDVAPPGYGTAGWAAAAGAGSEVIEP